MLTRARVAARKAEMADGWRKEGAWGYFGEALVNPLTVKHYTGRLDVVPCPWLHRG